MYGSEISASSGGIFVVSSHTAGRPSGVSTPLPSSISSKIACETASRGPSSSVKRSPAAQPPPGRWDNRSGRDSDGLAVLVPTRADPPALRLPERNEPMVRQRRRTRSLEFLAQRSGDRKAGAVTDLQKTPSACPTTTREPVAPVVACELDAVLLQPVNGPRRLAREDLDEAQIGGLM